MIEAHHCTLHACDLAKLNKISLSNLCFVNRFTRGHLGSLRLQTTASTRSTKAQFGTSSGRGRRGGCESPARGHSASLDATFDLMFHHDATSGDTPNQSEGLRSAAWTKKISVTEDSKRASNCLMIPFQEG
ncbi:unnamed protein product [Protopolystoma xenopodis]|uniref:Uncharacterized protein n=1 Tax=Protopolystoma xenopodis TaxID=117903 RepID=A0A3S5ACP1_9PLAT|nr:unnamed protein product [Protopolystoma xenopodis]